MRHHFSYHQASGYSLDHWLQQLPTTFSEQAEYLYRGRNELKMMRLPEGSEVIVKHFHRPNMVQRLHSTRTRRNKASNAFTNADLLKRCGIDTPAPVAFVEEYRHRLFLQSWLVYHPDYGHTLAELMEKLHDANPCEYYQLMADLARFVADMHSKGVVDLDMNPANILCHRSEGTEQQHFSFCLIDINRMRFFPADKLPSMSQCVESLYSLPRNALFDFDYFVACYLTARGVYSLAAFDETVNGKRHHDTRRHRQRKTRHRLGWLYYKLLYRK